MRESVRASPGGASLKGGVRQVGGMMMDDGSEGSGDLKAVSGSGTWPWRRAAKWGHFWQRACPVPVLAGPISALELLSWRRRDASVLNGRSLEMEIQLSNTGR